MARDPGSGARRPFARASADRPSRQPGRQMRSIRRRQGVARRIVLPGEPLIEGPTALRAWRDSDLQPLVTACQDPEISRWTRVPFPYGPSDARNYLLQRHDALHAGASAPFAIVLAEDRDHLLGSISLMRFSWKNARGEVGYWLARDARGQGHTDPRCPADHRTGGSSTSACIGSISSRPPGTRPPSESPSGAASLARRSCARTWSSKNGPRRHGRVRFARHATSRG